jgi:hypothetical protein
VEASSLSDSFNLQIALNVTCINPSVKEATSDYELFVIVLNKGQLNIDVAGTNDMKGLVGGDFLSSSMNYAKKIPALAHSDAEYAPQVSGALKSIGLGMGAGRGAGRGNGYSAGELIGSGIGGKLLDRKSLKDRLK